MKSDSPSDATKPIRSGLFGRTVTQPEAAKTTEQDAQLPHEAMGLSIDTYDFMRQQHAMDAQGRAISRSPWADLGITQDEFNKVNESFDPVVAAGDTRPVDTQSVIRSVSLNQNRRTARQGGAIPIER